MFDSVARDASSCRPALFKRSLSDARGGTYSAKAQVVNAAAPPSFACAFVEAAAYADMWLLTKCVRHVVVHSVDMLRRPHFGIVSEEWQRQYA